MHSLTSDSSCQAPTIRRKHASKSALERRDPFKMKRREPGTFFPALYYKARGTPWRLVRDPSQLSACFVGISFYESLDRSRLTTSMAQVFNELGEGVVVRGGAASLSKEDRRPHLSGEDCQKLIADALTRYRDVHFTLPARVLIHKSSAFSADEEAGGEATPPVESSSAFLSLG